MQQLGVALGQPQLTQPFGWQPQMNYAFASLMGYQQPMSAQYVNPQPQIIYQSPQPHFGAPIHQLSLREQIMQAKDEEELIEQLFD